MSNPLLFFDSGVGGLSVLGHVREMLPDAPLVYCADTEGYPYGEKTEAELSVRVPILLGRLTERYRPRLVVIACNTASTIALSAVRSVLHLPVVGTVPAIKPAACCTRTKVFGVLGTAATVRQAYVDQLVAEHAQDCTVLRHGTGALVGYAEAELRGQSVPLAAYQQVMAGLFDQPSGDQMDTVVLACTHFPLVRAQLEAASPRALQWVDSGAGIARRVAFLTQDHVWAPRAGANDRTVFTAEPTDLDLLRPTLAQYGLMQMELLSER
jgi:glutamate racemase